MQYKYIFIIQESNEQNFYFTSSADQTNGSWKFSLNLATLKGDFNIHNWPQSGIYSNKKRQTYHNDTADYEMALELLIY